MHCSLYHALSCIYCARLWLQCEVCTCSIIKLWSSCLKNVIEQIVCVINMIIKLPCSSYQQSISGSLHRVIWAKLYHWRLYKNVEEANWLGLFGIGTSGIWWRDISNNRKSLSCCRSRLPWKAHVVWKYDCHNRLDTKGRFYRFRFKHNCHSSVLYIQWGKYHFITVLFQYRSPCIVHTKAHQNLKPKKYNSRCNFGKYTTVFYKLVRFLGEIPWKYEVAELKFTCFANVYCSIFRKKCCFTAGFHFQQGRGTEPCLSVIKIFRQCNWPTGRIVKGLKAYMYRVAFWMPEFNYNTRVQNSDSIFLILNLINFQSNQT